MFVVTVSFEIKPGKEAAFRDAVAAQAANSLQREPGECLRFDVCQSPLKPERFFLYEIYREAASFDRHLQSEHFHQFDAQVRGWVSDKSVETWSLLP